jgi:hypothetical protein
MAGAVEGVQIIKEVVSKGGRGKKWAAQNGGQSPVFKSIDALD